MQLSGWGTQLRVGLLLPLILGLDGMVGHTVGTKHKFHAIYVQLFSVHESGLVLPVDWAFLDVGRASYRFHALLIIFIVWEQHPLVDNTFKS